MKKFTLVVFWCIFFIPCLYCEDNFSYLSFYPEEDKVMVEKYSKMFDIPIEIMVRQDFLESSFDPETKYLQKDGYYSIGYKQLNTRWVDYFVEKFYTLEEDFNINSQDHLYYITSAYLRYLIDEFDSVFLALVAFNCGETKVRNDFNNIPQRSKDYAWFIMFGEGRGCYEIREKHFSYLFR